MAIVQTLTKVTRTAGTLTLPSFTVPAGSRRIGLVSSVTNWPTTDGGTPVVLALELSRDGGASWQPACRMVYAPGLNSRTGLAPAGPAPGYEVDPPFAVDILAQWTITLDRTLDVGGTVTVD